MSVFDISFLVERRLGSLSGSSRVIGSWVWFASAGRLSFSSRVWLQRLGFRWSVSRRAWYRPAPAVAPGRGYFPLVSAFCSGGFRG